VQTQVLEDLADAHNYRRWIASLARPWLGDDPLEIGSGLGDLAAEVAAAGSAITVSEAEPGRLHSLRRRFDDDRNVTVRELRVPIRDDAAYSAVLAVNVLEHIADDVSALRDLARLLRPGGSVVLFVPAFEFAMSRFDREIGHHRRYTKRSLTAALRAAGYDVVAAHYVNAVGLLAWVVVMRLLRQRPGAGPVLWVFDRLVVPVLRRVGARVRPPFGQSVFAVGRLR